MRSRRATPLALGISVLAVASFAGCGGGGAPSATKAARVLVSSYSSAGVAAPKSELDCVSAKVPAGLSGKDLDAKKLVDLSGAGRAALAAAVQSCFSAGSLKQVFEKVVAGDIGLSPVAATCLADATAGKVTYPALVRQERAAVDVVAKAARKCVQAK